jgi:TP901 family phage tail tape measure protein
MAVMEGIRAPIVLDFSDVAGSAARFRTQLKKIQKDVGKTRMSFDGKYFEEFNKKTMQRLIKGFSQLENKALRLKGAITQLGKAMKQVREGGGIGRGQMDKFQSMPGIGAGTKGALAKYKSAQAAYVDDPEGSKKGVSTKETFIAAQKKLLHLLKQAEGVNKRNLELSKKQLDIKVQYVKRVQPAAITNAQRELKENSKLLEKAQFLMRLTRQGRATKQEQIKLYQQLNMLKKRGVKLTAENLALLKQTGKVAKKAGQGASAMSGGIIGRIKWFAQLRLLWGILEAFTSINEEMMQLDRASARAMRTMVRGVKEYSKVLKDVRRTIIEVGRITGATFEDIGEALYQLSSAGLTADEALSAVASTVKLATITEAGMTDTTKVVAGAYNNFKHSITGVANETEKFMKISGTLSYVWKRNQIDMNELVQGLNQSAQAGKLAGLKFSELAVILGNMGTRMIRSGRAGRMLRSAVINIAQKADKVRETFGIAFDDKKPLNLMEVMDKMNVKWKESGRSAATTASIFEIFGKRGAPALISMLDSWEKIRGEVDGLGTAMDLAVKQHETLLLTQQHYKQVTATMWKETFAHLERVVFWTKLWKGIMVSALDYMRGSRVWDEAAKSMSELNTQFKTAGDVTERLVQITAQLNLKRAEGLKDDEPLIKQYLKLIEKMTQLKDKLDAEEKSQTDLADAKKRNWIATKDLTTGYMLADAALHTWNIESGKTKLTLQELADEGVIAAKRLKDARDSFAEASEWAATEIGGMSPEVKTELKKANAEYLKIRDRYYKLVQEMQDAKTMDLSGVGKREDPMAQRTTEEAGFTISNKPGVLRYENDQMEVELERKKAVMDMEMGMEERMRARNLTKREEEELDREATLTQLAFEGEALTRRMEMAQQQIDAELAAAGQDDMDPAKQDAHMASAEALKTTLAGLQAQKILNTQAEKDAAITYDQFQKKRIEGIYKEQGAMKASGALWKSYGDVIGSHATVMADQWKTMFAEMGKESKAAWIAYQAIAISQAIIDTYKTAQAGASALAGIPFVGPALAGMWIATSVMQGMMRVQQIRSQKPQSAARGGVFAGSLEAYGDGGVTSGVATGIIGDNPSGKELVIPSENINKDNVSGHIQEAGGGGGVQIINMVTQTDIAQAMSESEEGKNVVINHIGRDMNEKGSTYNTMKKSNDKDQ